MRTLKCFKVYNVEGVVYLHVLSYLTQFHVCFPERLVAPVHTLLYVDFSQNMLTA